MVQIQGIRIMEDYPGRVARYTVDIRFVDPDKGTHVTDFGPMYNYDKALSFDADTLDDTVETIQDVLTERLCS